jgi:hypothetical protein
MTGVTHQPNPYMRLTGRKPIARLVKPWAWVKGQGDMADT